MYWGLVPVTFHHELWAMKREDRTERKTPVASALLLPPAIYVCTVLTH